MKTIFGILFTIGGLVTAVLVYGTVGAILGALLLTLGVYLIAQGQAEMAIQETLNQYALDMAMAEKFKDMPN